MVNLGKARVLLSGASGLIGSALLPALRTSGAQITCLTRDPTHVAQGEPVIPWHPGRPVSPDIVSGFDAVIHLAGESIVGRWTEAKKTAIHDSRVLGTRHLAQALSEAQNKPEVFICSSAIGYYGDRGDEVLNENSAPGRGFLSDVCREWEGATYAASDAGIRTVLLRTGVVLSPKGGALGKMLMPFKMGVGGRVGDGRQWMSWIDMQDMIGAVQHILTSGLRGPVNMVAPNPVTNAEFTKTLARVLSRPAIFPMPAAAVRLLFGEMGEMVLLGSQRVEAVQLRASGYSFHFNTLRESLTSILRA